MKQKQTKLSQTGSLMNWMMSSNSSIPEVGKGATELHYSDRTPYEVLEVANGGKSALIRQYDHKASRIMQMGEQEWELIPNENNPTYWVHWKWNAWRTKSELWYKTDKFWEDFETNKQSMEQEQLKIWLESIDNKKKDFPEYYEFHTEWNVKKLLFGHAEYYYDWSF
jgi:hypothetical protein